MDSFEDAVPSPPLLPADCDERSLSDHDEGKTSVTTTFQPKYFPCYPLSSAHNCNGEGCGEKRKRGKHLFHTKTVYYGGPFVSKLFLHDNFINIFNNSNKRSI